MLTTPEQQKEAAEAARKEGEELAKKEEKAPEVAPVPEPIAGSRSVLQKPENLNENRVNKVS